jgi:hypothetical protein
LHVPIHALAVWGTSITLSRAANNDSWGVPFDTFHARGKLHTKTDIEIEQHIRD